MASIDGLAIRELGPDAVTEAFALSVEVGWNQTVDDWAFSVAHGTVYGARDASGRLVATAAVLPYPGNPPDKASFAWISLVIVTGSQRGRGLGTRMLQQCIATLRSRGLVGLLDATPSGEQVYIPLGFKPIHGLTRWRGEGGANLDQSGRVRPLAATGLDRIAAADSAAFGAQRRALLAEFCARAGTLGFELADGSGYALMRSGRVASHLGPVIAPSAEDALALIETTATAAPGPVFIDVPAASTQLAGWLAAHGFAEQRPLRRMGLGCAAPYGEPARVFAIAGPEYG